MTQCTCLVFGLGVFVCTFYLQTFLECVFKSVFFRFHLFTILLVTEFHNQLLLWRVDLASVCCHGRK